MIDLRLGDCLDVMKTLKYDGGIELKPIYKLIELDVQRYGDNAFLMYQWRRDYDDLECCGYKKDVDWKTPQSNKDCEDLANCINYIVERKLYANAPFNLKWAAKGLKTEWRYLTGEWKEVLRHELVNCSIAENKRFGDRLIPGNGKVVYKIADLRHPFPPVCTEE